MDSFKAADNVPLRRQPKQDRSRGRVEEILKVAMQLLGEKGIDAVTMKEVAALSGGPISSVYQYFPNKSAILSMLYTQYSHEVRGILRDSLQDVRNVDDAFSALDTILDRYYRHIETNPALRDLLHAIQADKKLVMVDIAETRQEADVFTQATQGFVPEAARPQYGRIVFLMFQMTGSTVRTASMLGAAEAVEILADFRAIVHGQLRLLMDGSHAR